MLNIRKDTLYVLYSLSFFIHRDLFVSLENCRKNLNNFFVQQCKTLIEDLFSEVLFINHNIDFLKACMRNF